MRRRLIASTVAIALAAVLVLGVPLGIVESRRSRSEQISRLEREADGVAAAADERLRVGRPLDPRALSATAPKGHRVTVRARGAVVRFGRVAPGAVLTVRSGAGQGAQVVVEAPAADVARRERRVWLLVAALGLAGTAAAAVLATAQARRLTRPLARLTATSARLGTGDFSARTGPLRVPEFDRVGAALDAAAVQIAQLVGRQREFAGNVSHQLRSPLTALRLRLEELAGLPDEDARREAEAALALTDRLEATVTDLLVLARAGHAGAVVTLDLAVMARLHGEGWAPLFARAGRRLRVDVDVDAATGRGGLWAQATPGGVAQALDVLLDNALQHGAGATRLAARQEDGRAVLEVSDEGAGIPDEMRDRVFERNVSTVGSTGLGLSLARALVEADGGRLVLTEPRPARFEIRMPRPGGR
jgi:signal transduction histidine kinase